MNNLDKAFEELASECNENRIIRRELIGQLRKAASAMVIGEYDKPAMITAKLLIPKTLDDLLKSDEDISIKRLKMKLLRNSEEVNSNIGQTIVNLLKNIRLSGEPSDSVGKVDRDDVTAELQKIQEGNSELSITDGETEECGSTPSTDGDISVERPKETEVEE